MLSMRVCRSVVLICAAAFLWSFPAFANTSKVKRSVEKIRVRVSSPTDLYTTDADGRVVHLKKVRSPSFTIPTDSSVLSKFARPAFCRADEEKMLKMINDERAKKRLAPVIVDESLRAIAREHSADMAARGFFGHSSTGGKKLMKRVRNAGITFRFVAENIALGSEVELVHQCLIASAGHRSNILKSGARRVGIGIVASRGQKWFTQVFVD